MDQVNIKRAPVSGVEDGIPVVAFFLELRRQLLNVQISQDVLLVKRYLHLVLRHEGVLLVVGRRGWSGNLRRSREGSRVVLLGSRRTSWRAARRTWALSARRGCGLWGLTVTCAGLAPALSELVHS